MKNALRIRSVASLLTMAGRPREPQEVHRMRGLRLTALAALATAAFTTVGAAQSRTLDAIPVDTPVQKVHLDLDTGMITRMGTMAPGADALPSSCFATSIFSGFFSVPTAGTELVDWGTKCLRALGRRLRADHRLRHDRARSGCRRIRGDGRGIALRRHGRLLRPQGPGR